MLARGGGLRGPPGLVTSPGSRVPSGVVKKRARSRPAGLLGVFLAQLDDSYQIEVWRGIEERASLLGLGVVCFVGQRMGAPNEVERAANVAYRLAHGKNIHGLIVLSSAIATYLDGAELEAFFARRKDLPQVSVGLKVAGYPSVTVDGSAALAELVRHLALHHGRRHFAMIDGPAGHPEAADRAHAFRGTLHELGIEPDRRLTAEGNFLRISGVAAARRLLATRRPIDALVCMNDRMALGAMDVLRARGIRVPEDIAVVGFDGIEEGRYVTPPLTTVRQPLRELGAASVESMAEAMAGLPVSDRVLGGQTEIRHSCGCPPRKTFDPDLKRLPHGTPRSERQAVADLVSLARKRDAERFVVRLNGALSRTAIEGGDLRRWSSHLSVIRSRVGGHNARTASLFEFSRALLGETQVRLQAARRVASEERFSRLRAVSASLAGAFDLPLLLDRLREGLSELAVAGGYLAVFDPPGPEPERARLLMRPAARPPLPQRGMRFHALTLLPPRVGTAWRRRRWVLQPLVFQTEPLGFILLPGGVQEPAVYDTLRQQVGSALKGALLLEQVTTHERRLEQEVLRRTAEVTRSNAELTQEMERRMRLEREVTEISNRTMQRIGQDLHDDLCQHLAGIAMHTSVLRGELSALAPSAALSLERIGDLLEDSIARAKRIARGLYPAGLAEHGLAAAVEELVEAARQNYPAAIDFRASPDIRCPNTEKALQVYRIVQEALTNSLRHSGSSRIEVLLWCDEEGGNDHRGSTLTAVVRDFGAGIPDTVPTQGMGLRIMRYRAELAGADLSIQRRETGTCVSCTVRFEREAS